MSELVKTIYKCYRGNSLGYRTAAIDSFVRTGGKWFFKEYGTGVDSISGFISKAEKLGLYK